MTRVVQPRKQSEIPKPRKTAEALDAEMIEDVREAASVGKRYGGIDLSGWEVDFMDSIEERVTNGGDLSEAQRERLVSIWDRI